MVTVTNSNNADPATIADALAALCEPGAIYELRVLGSRRGTVSGYYDGLPALASDAAKCSGRSAGVYVTLNPVEPALLARSANHMTAYAKHTTTDADITCRRWILLDFDPSRPSGISSSDDEHEAALARAKDCRDWLIEEGFIPASLLLADSGNGAHILLRVDLPNDDKAKALVQSILAAVADRFGDEAIIVDTGTFNAARISKVYGTIAAKGDSLPERPHRLSGIIDAPPLATPAPMDVLESLAGLAPMQALPHARASGRSERLDIDLFISQYLADTAAPPKPWEGGRRWVLTPCPFDPAHNNGSAVIIQQASGALGFKCHHTSCQGRDWHALRQRFEPRQDGRPAQVRDKTGPAHESAPMNSPEGLIVGGREALVPASSASNILAAPRTADWPQLSQVALHGLIGEIVQTIAPTTEADIAALLTTLLVFLGSMIGRSAHGMAESSRHYLNLFACLVGETSKGRKGASQSRVLSLAKRVDPEWAENRIFNGLSSGEGLIVPVADRIEEDEDGARTTYPCADPRLLVVEEELSRTLSVMGRQGNTLSQLLRQAWDGGRLQVMTRNAPLSARRSHISILAHVSAEELIKSLNRVDFANGFANRFLWICVRRSKRLPEGGNEPNVNPYVFRLKSIIDFAGSRSGHPFERDPAARRLWADVYGPLSEGKQGIFGAAVNRAEAQVFRLSILYAVADRSPVVQRQHLEAALAFWQYAEDSARWAFERERGDQIDERILIALRQIWPQELTRSQINNLFAHNVKAERLGAALERLQTPGLIESHRVETGGRPAEQFQAVGGPFDTYFVNSSSLGSPQDNAEPLNGKSRETVGYEIDEFNEIRQDSDKSLESGFDAGLTPETGPTYPTSSEALHERREATAMVDGDTFEVPCYACGGLDFWYRGDGEQVCQRCHPMP
jgi:hypothetical protein